VRETPFGQGDKSCRDVVGGAALRWGWDRESGFNFYYLPEIVTSILRLQKVGPPPSPPHLPPISRPLLPIPDCPHSPHPPPPNPLFVLPSLPPHHPPPYLPPPPFPSPAPPSFHPPPHVPHAPPPNPPSLPPTPHAPYQHSPCYYPISTPVSGCSEGTIAHIVVILRTLSIATSPPRGRICRRLLVVLRQGFHPADREPGSQAQEGAVKTRAVVLRARGFGIASRTRAVVAAVRQTPKPPRERIGQEPSVDLQQPSWSKLTKPMGSGHLVVQSGLGSR